MGKAFLNLCGFSLEGEMVVRRHRSPVRKQEEEKGGDGGMPPNVFHLAKHNSYVKACTAKRSILLCCLSIYPSACLSATGLTA